MAALLIRDGIAQKKGQLNGHIKLDGTLYQNVGKILAFWLIMLAAAFVYSVQSGQVYGERFLDQTTHSLKTHRNHPTAHLYYHSHHNDQQHHSQHVRHHQARREFYYKKQHRSDDGTSVYNERYQQHLPEEMRWPNEVSLQEADDFTIRPSKLITDPELEEAKPNRWVPRSSHNHHRHISKDDSLMLADQPESSATKQANYDQDNTLTKQPYHINSNNSNKNIPLIEPSLSVAQDMSSTLSAIDIEGHNQFRVDVDGAEVASGIGSETPALILASPTVMSTAHILATQQPINPNTTPFSNSNDNEQDQEEGSGYGQLPSDFNLYLSNQINNNNLLYNLNTQIRQSANKDRIEPTKVMTDGSDLMIPATPIPTMAGYPMDPYHSATTVMSEYQSVLSTPTSSTKSQSINPYNNQSFIPSGTTTVPSATYIGAPNQSGGQDVIVVDQLADDNIYNNNNNQLNHAPILNKRLPKLVCIAGRFWKYSIPADTFVDEDGNLRYLKSTLSNLAERGQSQDGYPAELAINENNSKNKQEESLEAYNSWIQYDPEAQLLYAFPSVRDLGRHEFALVVGDKQGALTSEMLELQVRQHPSYRAFTHQFHLNRLQWNQYLYLSLIDALSSVARRLTVNLFRDAAYRNFLFQSFRTGSYSGDHSATGIDKSFQPNLHQHQRQQDPDQFIFTLSWSNDSLPVHPCPKDQIESLFKLLIDASSYPQWSMTNGNRQHQLRPSAALLEALEPEFKLASVSLSLMAACATFATGPIEKDSNYVIDDPGSVPILRNKIEKLTWHLGELIQFAIPEDTFQPAFGSGSARDLNLALLTIDGTPLDRHSRASFINFDEQEQCIYGLATSVSQHVGLWEFILVARDPVTNQKSQDVFLVEVKESPLSAPSQDGPQQSFSSTIYLVPRIGSFNLRDQIQFGQRLASLFVDPEPVSSMSDVEQFSAQQEFVAGGKLSTLQQKLAQIHVEDIQKFATINPGPASNSTLTGSMGASVSNTIQQQYRPVRWSTNSGFKYLQEGDVIRIEEITRLNSPFGGKQIESNYFYKFIWTNITMLAGIQQISGCPEAIIRADILDRLANWGLDSATQSGQREGADQLEMSFTNLKRYFEPEFELLHIYVEPLNQCNGLFQKLLLGPKLLFAETAAGATQVFDNSSSNFILTDMEDKNHQHSPDRHNYHYPIRGYSTGSRSSSTSGSREMLEENGNHSASGPGIEIAVMFVLLLIILLIIVIFALLTIFRRKDMLHHQQQQRLYQLQHQHQQQIQHHQQFMQTKPPFGGGVHQMTASTGPYSAHMILTPATPVASKTMYVIQDGSEHSAAKQSTITSSTTGTLPRSTTGFGGIIPNGGIPVVAAASTIHHQHPHMRGLVQHPSMILSSHVPDQHLNHQTTYHHRTLGRLHHNPQSHQLPSYQTTNYNAVPMMLQSNVVGSGHHSKPGQSAAPGSLSTVSSSAGSVSMAGPKQRMGEVSADGSAHKVSQVASSTVVNYVSGMSNRSTNVQLISPPIPNSSNLTNGGGPHSQSIGANQPSPANNSGSSSTFSQSSSTMTPQSIIYDPVAMRINSQ